MLILGYQYKHDSRLSIRAILIRKLLCRKSESDSRLPIRKLLTHILIYSNKIQWNKLSKEQNLRRWKRIEMEEGVTLREGEGEERKRGVSIVWFMIERKSGD